MTDAEELERAKREASLICNDILRSDECFERVMIGFVSPRFTIGVESIRLPTHLTP